MTARDSHGAARWRAARTLVDAALALPAAARADFLDRADADAAVRADAVRWLAACARAESAGDFLAQPAAERAAPLLTANPPADARSREVPFNASDARETDATGELETLRRALAPAYALEREIGRGGMAAVYLALDRRHGRRVALKVLRPDLTAAVGAERFVREIAVTAELQHPHILPLFDSGEAAGRLYYVMPYVEGETLRDRLARAPRLTVADSVRLVRAVAAALDYAHRHDVVHRDVKPANILLADGHAVVADFGIARALRRSRPPRVQRDASEADAGERDAPGDRAGCPTALTDAGTSPGTPAYMAPEQARGDADVDHRADLYALGVVAYEALAGGHPFGAGAARRGAGALALATYRPDVPPALAVLVTRLLAEDPAARPPSAAAVITALDAVRPASGRFGMGPLGAEAFSSSTVGVEALGIRPPRRAAAWTGAGIAAIVVALVVGGGTLAVRDRAGLRAAAIPHEAGAARPAAVQTVAVLPFVNAGGTAADDYLSDGLTDELAHALAQLPALRLAGRTSSRAFGGQAVAAPAVGRALGVGALVEGTVRRAGDRLRVRVQLVRAADGTVLWDGVTESRSRDVFAVQDEVTRAVIAALGPALGVREASPSGAAARRGTNDEEAYDLYLQGRYFWSQRGAANLGRAIAAFRQAIARDPAFARAHAGLGMAYSTLRNFPPDSGDATPTLTAARAERLTALSAASAERAVALDSALADAQLALALTLDDRLRFRDALARYRAAVARDPSSVTGHHWLGMSLLNLGRTEEALVELRHATELDPLAPTPASALALGLVYARRFPEARIAARRAVAIDSVFPYAIWPLGLAQAFGGQPDSAVRTFARGVRLHPGDPRMATGLLLTDAAAGRWADAARVRAQLHRAGEDRSGWADAAVADLVFGDRAPLVRVLTSDAGQHRYIGSGALFGCNPILDPLWADPRFRTAMRRLTVRPCRLARPWPFRPPPRP